MKTKVLILLFFVLNIVSCDVSTPFVIEKEREHFLYNNCGKVQIKGSSFSTSVWIAFKFAGDYIINTELLKIESASSDDIITNTRFELNNRKFTGHEIKNGDVITISCNLQSTVPHHKSNGTILIPPSNFITCEGKAIISDTIRIQLRN